MRAVRTPPAWLLLAIVAGACAHAPKGAPAAGAPADFFPLAVGNEWVYADRSPQLSAKDQASRQRTVRILSRDADGYYLDNEKGALRADPDCLHDRLRRLLCGPFEPGHAWSSAGTRRAALTTSSRTSCATAWAEPDPGQAAAAQRGTLAPPRVRPRVPSVTSLRGRRRPPGSGR